MPVKICKGITLSGKPCKAQAVVKKFDPKTGKKFNTDYCQMHQPSRKRKVCVCKKV